MIEIMLQFQNVGFVQQSEKQTTSSNKERTSTRLSYLDKIVDNFKPIDTLSIHGEKLVWQAFDKNMFQKTDRVSLNQFLSLFNVIGVSNGRKL